MNYYALAIVFGFIVMPLLILALILIRIIKGIRYEIETVNIMPNHIEHSFEVTKKINLDDNLFKDNYSLIKRPYHFLIRGIRKKYLKVLKDGEPIKYNISDCTPEICYIAYYSNAITKSFNADFSERTNVNFKQVIIFAFVFILILVVYSWWSGGQKPI